MAFPSQILPYISSSMVDSDDKSQPMSNLVKQTYSYQDDYYDPAVLADPMDQSEKVSSKLVCIQRYYLCLHTNFDETHRTALVFENGIRDVTVKKSYSSIDDWSTECNEWNNCGQCTGSISIEYAVSQEESARKKAEKNALRTEKQMQKNKLLEEIRFERQIKKTIIQLRKASVRIEKETRREQKKAQKELEKMEKQMAKLHMREEKQAILAHAIIESKEELDVE